MIQDRIRELRRVNASDLLPNPENWRRHPSEQRKALEAVLERIGFADAVLARETADGKLMLIDGHLRAETVPDQEIPVLVLDVDEDEARELLATIDPLASMAQTDEAALAKLLTDAAAGSEELEKHLVTFYANGSSGPGGGGGATETEKAPSHVPAGMKLELIALTRFDGENYYGHRYATVAEIRTGEYPQGFTPLFRLVEDE